MREILVHCRDSQDTEVLQKQLSTLLTTQGHAAKDVKMATFQSVLEALELLTNKPEVNPADEMPNDLASAWDYPCGAMATAVKQIAGNPKTSLEFTKVLLDGFEERSEKFRVVVLQILFVMLSDEVPDDMAQVVKGLESVTLDPESRVVPMIQELVGAVS